MKGDSTSFGILRHSHDNRSRNSVHRMLVDCQYRSSSPPRRIRGRYRSSRPFSEIRLRNRSTSSVLASSRVGTASQLGNGTATLGRHLGAGVVQWLPAKIATLESSGYDLLGYFTLPARCWIDNDYTPTAPRIPDFLKRHIDIPQATEIVDME